MILLVINGPWCTAAHVGRVGGASVEGDLYLVTIMMLLEWTKNM